MRRPVLNDRTLRFLFLFLLLIPCWAIYIKYEVDLPTIHYVASVLPDAPLQAYEPKAGLPRFFYGPFTLVLLRPLSALSFLQLKVVWLIFQTIAYFVFWLTLERLFPYLKEKGAFWKWCVIWVFAINPIHNNFQSNNIQLMLAAALILTEWWGRSRRSELQIAAGVFCVFAAAVKVFPAFLLPFYFIVGSKRLRGGLGIGVAVALLAPLLLFGPTTGVDLYQSFLRNLVTYQGDNSFIHIPDILCLPSLLTRYLNPLLSAEVIGNIVKAVILVISAAFFAFACKIRRSRFVWSLAWALMILLNPSTRVHYFIFAVPLACFLLREKSRAAFVGMALLALTTEGVIGKAWNDYLEHASVPTWGLILLCVLAPPLLLRELRNQMNSVANR